MVRPDRNGLPSLTPRHMVIPFHLGGTLVGVELLTDDRVYAVTGDQQVGLNPMHDCIPCSIDELAPRPFPLPVRSGPNGGRCGHALGRAGLLRLGGAPLIARRDEWRTEASDSRRLAREVHPRYAGRAWSRRPTRRWGCRPRRGRPAGRVRSVSRTACGSTLMPTPNSLIV